MTGLTPMPKKLEIQSGWLDLSAGKLILWLQRGACLPVRVAAEAVADALSHALRSQVQVRATTRLANAQAIVARSGTSPPRHALRRRTRLQGYRLEVTREAAIVGSAGRSDSARPTRPQRAGIATDGLAYGLRTLAQWIDTRCKTGRLRCVRIEDWPDFEIRALLAHVSYNMWGPPPPKTKGGRRKPSGRERTVHYSPRLRFNEQLFRQIVQRMAEMKMNMIVLDLGDGIRYRSHPELAVKGALSRARLRALLGLCRDHGLEPIPKLNFSTVHDLWLGPYEKMVGSEPYDRVCADLIAEVSELFEGPRLFHLGMDEETLEHHRGLRLEHVVIRQGQAWLDALLKLDGFVRANGARSWIWADPLWPGRSTENAKVPKRIMLSDWHYHVADDYPSMRRLDQLGYENIPTSSNWSRDENAAHLAQFTFCNLVHRRARGMLQTIWRPTTPLWQDNYLNGITLAARGFWNVGSEPPPGGSAAQHPGS